MTGRLASAVVVGALAAVFTAGAVAQIAAPMPNPKGYIAGAARCDPNNCGYWISATAAPENNVVRSGVYNGDKGLAGNLCWRSGYWTPAMAIAQCEPDL